MLHGFLPSLLAGALLTLAVALASLTIAIVLGLVGAAMKLSRSRACRWLATAYTTVIRGVPDLVLMLLIYYGGQTALNALTEKMGYAEQIDVNPFLAGVLTIGFIFGAYLTETFRGAIQAIPSGQRDAGLAFGMTPMQVFFRITMPQMVRLALPGFANNWLVMVKSTALVSIIGLNDMMRRAEQAAGSTHEPFTFYLAVGALYLAITTLSIGVLRLMETRFSRGVRSVAL
jgi:arginine/ornithine transport system permease protein